MSKAFQLQIPKPCYEKWEQMTNADKGKFCSSCQKQVMDFTAMSDRELVAFFKKPSTGSVCGRFNHDQLNKEFEIPKKRVPWLKYFFTIALPTFLASSKAVAQGQVRKIERIDTTSKTVEKIITMGKPDLSFNCIKPDNKKGIKIIEQSLEFTVGQVAAIIPEKVITGNVIDEKGFPVPFSTIMIKGTKRGVTADNKGNFTLNLDTENPIIIISAAGYETKEQAIDLNKKDNIISIEMIELKTALLGELIITKCYKPGKPMPLFKQIFKDTAFKNFKLFPNPVHSGSTITLQWKRPESGEFEIQLLNQNGQVVDRNTESHIDKVSSTQYTLPTITAGNYFLILINHKTGKRLTEKIMVQ